VIGYNEHGGRDHDRNGAGEHSRGDLPQTVGRARVNVELEIVDDDGRGCPSGAVGRVRCGRKR